MRARWLPALVGLLGVGCGITEEVHTQTVRDLDKCRQDLATARADFERVQSELDTQKAPVAPSETRPGQIDPKEVADLERARDATQRRAEQGKQLAAALAPLAQSGTLKVGAHKGRIAVALPDK